MKPVETYRNIRYARADRFEQPELLPWDGIQRGERGPICPQSPSRLAIVQGPSAPMDVSEDCQVLSVFTPGTSGRRPVMVFFHGGAFVSGGGELPWYDGNELAAEQDVVVVSVSYRLGAFGYFLHPSGVDPSPGMSDQVTALEWVQANISDLGGDPDNVTVFGQSAGGISIVAMLEWGHGGTLFHRAILQSGAIGVARTRDEMDATSRAFLAALGQDPRTASPDDIVDAQRRLAVDLGQLLVWGAISPDAPIGSAVDIIAGWCKDDLLPFVLLDAQVEPAPGTEKTYAAVTAKRNELFEGGSRSLARDMVAEGKRASLYRFEWSSPDSGLGACHCIELFFLLGSEDAWRGAPALGATRWDEVEAIGRRMRGIWGAFARGDADARWLADEVRVLP